MSDRPSSPIDASEVRRIAALAHLDVTEADVAALGADLARIVDHVRRLETLDLSGVPPTTHVVAAAPAGREDAPRESLRPEDALDGAPVVESGHFVVPRVLPT